MKKILVGVSLFFAGVFSLHAQNLYSTTFYGGDADAGTIIKFIPATNGLTVPKNFDNANGANPYGSLMQASDGKLYGMTSVGGSGNFGIIFSFNPSTSIYTKLKDFDSINGANPHGSLMQASDGKLYGMTYNGGSMGYGVIFSFDPSSSTYKKLKDFNNFDGANPSGSLMQAIDGKLYGLTDQGGKFTVMGKYSWGVIFSFDLSSSTYTDLKDFNDANFEGAGPSGNLIQASNGKLYGTTHGGGGDQYNGVIFSFDPSSSTYTRLWGFDNTTATGNDPSGSLIQATNGKLYGMTTTGLAQASYGVIFSYDILASAYTENYDFDGTNGSYPSGSLVQAGNGKLYGGTFSGGGSDEGVIFSYDPASATFTHLLDFNGANGARPFSAFIEVKEAGSLPVTLVSFTGKNDGNSNVLSWEVENEQQLSYYELQRSTDGHNFEDISQVNAAGNNNYTYTDHIAPAVSSVYYYRLKIVDKDGNFTFSAIVILRSYLKEFLVVYPNPFYRKLVVSIKSPVQDKAVLIITDVNGRTVYKENKVLSQGTNIIEIHDAGRLSRGSYLLTITDSQQTQSIKLVKGK